MKLGDVLKKERERNELSPEDVAARLHIPVKRYLEMEAGNSPAEQWGARLALIAIKLQTPTARLIAETGKAAQAGQVKGQCGNLIKSHRQKRGLLIKDLAEKLDMSAPEIESIEDGTSPLETYAPLLLAFAETVNQPIFNLFYPCSLPYAELNDYP
jgi:transcriptional regulator with XRE-family HTH domain